MNARETNEAGYQLWKGELMDSPCHCGEQLGYHIARQRWEHMRDASPACNSWLNTLPAMDVAG